MNTDKLGVRPKLDDVDRAVADAQRAVDTLVRLLTHADHNLALKAALTVGEVGSLPVRPLIAAFSRAKSSHHRLAMLVLLRELAPPFDLEVIGAMSRVLESDPSNQVKTLAEQVLGEMRDRTLQRSKKEKPPETAVQDDQLQSDSSSISRKSHQ